MRTCETRTITYDDVTITVTEATVLTSMTRSRLKAEAMESSIDELDQDVRVLALVTYPDLMAASVNFGGMGKPTFSEFLTLPEALLNPWVEAVYALNPHWLGMPQEEQEKKV